MKNWEYKQRNSFLECQKGFLIGRSCIDQLFSMKLLIENRREFNLQTHLAFLDYVKNFNKVKREKLFEILQSKKYSQFIIKNCNINLLRE